VCCCVAFRPHGRFPRVSADNFMMGFGIEQWANKRENINIVEIGESLLNIYFIIFGSKLLNTNPIGIIWCVRYFDNNISVLYN